MEIGIPGATGANEFDSRFYSLQEQLFVNAIEDEIAMIEGHGIFVEVRMHTAVKGWQTDEKKLLSFGEEVGIKNYD